MSPVDSNDSNPPNPPRLKYKPRNPTRRSEAERSELPPNVVERNTVEAGFRGRGGRRRGRGSFRGGFRDLRDENPNRQRIRTPAGPATGFLSGPTLEEAIATKGNRGGRARRARGRLLAAAEDLSARVATSAAGASGGTSKKSGRIKQEGKTSTTKGKELVTLQESEDEIDVYDGDADEEGGIDVDNIASVNLVSDDEEDSLGPSGQVASSRSRKYAARGMNPVRVERNEHISRTVGVSTDASSATSSRIRQKAKEAGISARNVSVFAGDGSKVPKSKSARGKGKEREVEIVGNKRVWHGAYSDDEPDEPKIKEEEDETHATSLPPIAAADPATHTADLATSAPVQEIETTRHDDASPKDVTLTEEPPKLRKRRGSWRPYNFQEQQTKEDHAEWERMKADMADVKRLLGPVDELSEHPRHDNVFLFQLPPVMPSTITPEELAKREEEADAQRSSEVDEKATSTRKKAKSSRADEPPSTEGGPSETAITDADGNEIVVKPEDDSGQPGQSDDYKARPFFTAGEWPSTGGQIGTLTVYENGSTILDWGGIEFEIKKGMGSHLQEVVLLDGEYEESGDNGDTREANSMSEIQGTFIATPEWEQFFGARNE